MINYGKMLEIHTGRMEKLEKKIENEERHLSLHVKDWQTKIQYILDKADLYEMQKKAALLEYRKDLQQYM